MRISGVPERVIGWISSTWTSVPRRYVRPTAAVLAVALLALSVIALRSGPGPSPERIGTTERGDEVALGPGGDTSDGETPGGESRGAPGTRGSTRRSGAGTAGTAGTLAGARASYQGVTDKEIRVGFTWQMESCGGFFGPGLAVAFGVPQPEDQEAITAGLEYFQKFPHEFLANAPSDVKANVTAATGYWGRSVKPFFETNGGPFCADAARATVAKFAEQSKVFGAVQIPNDGANYVLSTEMAARKLLNIGAAGFRNLDYKNWDPYVWEVTFSGSKAAAQAWASWACRDLVEGTSFDTGDPRTAKKPRVLGLLYPDDPVYKGLAAEVKATMKSRCNAGFKTEIAYSVDVGQAQQTSNTAISRMINDQVTTVYFLTDILFPAFFTAEATKQLYYPEWAVSSVGFQDIAFVIRKLWEETQRKNAFGASQLVAFERDKWVDTPQYKAFKKVRPNREPPGNWNNWYLNMAVFYLGVAGAGPVLTPATFADGLERICSPCSFSGQISLKTLLLGFGRGDPTGTDDFTLVKFNPNKEDIYDPPDQYGRRQIGYWDFPENGLRYLGTIDKQRR